jgi:hypothetical protein
LGQGVTGKHDPDKGRCPEIPDNGKTGTLHGTIPPKVFCLDFAEH